MSIRLAALCIDANDPHRLGRFWAGLLGGSVTDEPDAGVSLDPVADPGFRIRFRPSDAPKTVPDQMHFDLTSSSLSDQASTVARVLELGGRHIDVGQRPEEGHVVLADPEGNELCVVGPGNQFLAGCGFIGALSCDGSQKVGYFWGAALGWPLVWDQDEETAIQSPAGGPKISWGGPPYAERATKNRLHFDLVPKVDSDQATEVERLISLGAKRIDIGQDDVDWIVMADPDGNQFCVLP